MFLGSTEVRLDEKGRFILPAIFRKGFKDSLVLTKGTELSLVIYPFEVFTEKYRKIAQANRADKDTRNAIRLIMSGASEQRIDRQWRVAVPPKLRKFAQLTRGLTINGDADRLELWDTERWNDYEENLESIFPFSDGQLPPGVL